MAGKKQHSDRVRITTPRGVLRYPYLTRADDKFAEKGAKPAFKTSLVVPAEDAAPLVAKLTEMAEAKFAQVKGDLENRVASSKGTDKVKAREKLGKLKLYLPFSDDVDDEGDPNGFVIFKFKLDEKGKNTKTGETWKNKVALFDSRGTALNPKKIKIWGGSEGYVSGIASPFYNDATGDVGVSLRLSAVQIVKLVSGDTDADASAFGFGRHDDGFDSRAFEADDDDDDEDQDDSSSDDDGEDDSAEVGF